MKKDKNPSYLNLGILTVITTISWIFFSVYRTLTAKPVPNVPAEILAPFSPTLDTEKIGQIETRLFFEEGAVPLVSPEPSATPTPSASPTLIPTPTPEATQVPTGSGAPAL